MTEQERRRAMTEVEKVARAIEDLLPARIVAELQPQTVADIAQAAIAALDAARAERLAQALRRIELNAHTTGRIAIRDEARAALTQEAK